MRRQTFAATASLATALIVVAGAAATTNEARSLSVATSYPPGNKVVLTGRVKSPHSVPVCVAGAPVRLERRGLTGRWALVRSGRTDAKGKFSWTIIGFKARARVVVPQVNANGYACAPVTLGFDRGYLSPG